MSELKITTVLDNSAIDKGLEKTKAEFDELYAYIKKKDFGEEFGKQLSGINKEVEDSVKFIENKVAELQHKIDDLTIKKNQALSQGDGNAAGSFQFMIDGLVKERTELLKNLSEYQNYKDEIKKAAETAETFLTKQERNASVFSKLGTVIKVGAVGGMKALITATKAFLHIGLVAVVNAIAMAFASLVKYIKSTETGQMAIAKVTGYLSGLFNSLKTTTMQVGKAMYNAFTTVKPAVDAVINRVAALVAVINSLVKIGGKALSRDWEGVAQEFETMKGNMKAVLTGNLFDSTQVGQIKAQAEYTKDLYAAREQLRKQTEKWSEEKSGLELQIAEAEAEGDQARVKALNDKIYNKELDYLQQEYDIEKKLVDLKGDSAKTTEDERKLRDLRTEINELKTAKIQSDTRDNRKGDSAAAKEEQELQRQKAAEEKRLRLEEEMQNELNAMIDANQEARLSIMSEGTKKELAEIQQSYDKKAEEIRKQQEKWKKENQEIGKTNLGDDGLTNGQRAAINAANSYNEAAREKAVNEIAKRNREQYLREYGTYEEKKLAINEEYIKKVLATEDEYERKSLAKKREKDLEDLRKQYDTSYNLIFADASRLSDELLVKAINATQAEIKKATKDGDIQALTSLYERLREQLQAQTSRNGEWGFVGIAEAFKDIEGARKDLEAAVASGDQAKVIKATANYQAAIDRVQKRAEQVRSTFSDIASIMEGMGGRMGEIGSGLGSLADAAKNIMDIMSQEKSGQKFDKGASIATVFTSAIELGAMLAKSIQANKEAQKAWNMELERSAHNLTMLNLQALDYKQQNIFGVENPYKKAIDGAKQYAKAMEDLQAQVKKLNNGKVQTGTKRAIDWSNVGKGAAIGASAGAIAGAGVWTAITTEVGAAIGAAAGIITGLLSSKVVPVFENLTAKYGQVITEDFELNPQILADYNKLDDETKQLVDNWKDIKAAAEEAEEQMHETFTNLAGDLGGQLSDSLVNAFKNGKLNSAIDDFHDKMSDTIEDIIEQMIFSNVFSDMFDNLQKEMEESFSMAGDQNIVDDLMRFEEAYQQGLEEYGKQMDAAKKYMQENGYSDAFKSEESRTGLSKSSLGASQDSIDESNGRLTAIQGQVFQINETVLSFAERYERLIANTAAMLEHTQGIHVDTTELKGMVSEMRELSRSVRTNVSTIVDKGVKML